MTIGSYILPNIIIWDDGYSCFIYIYTICICFSTQHFYSGRFIIVHCDNPHESNMISFCSAVSVLACGSLMSKCGGGFFSLEIVVKLLNTWIFLRKCKWSFSKVTCEAVLGSFWGTGSCGQHETMERSVVNFIRDVPKKPARNFSL